MTTTYDIAASFLRELGAPTHPAMVRAVALWLRFESGTTVRGNNPWNLHGGPACPATQGYCPGNKGVHKGQIGNRYAGSGDRNVAVFATLQDGIAASAANLIRLRGSGYGYDKMIAEARQGDALGFLIALQNSSWSAGHYGHSKLVAAFNGSHSYKSTVSFVNYGGGGGNTTPTTPTLDDILTRLGIPTDDEHVITEAEARKLADQYKVTGSVYDAIVRTFSGKTVKWLRDNAGGISTTPLPGEPGGIGGDEGPFAGIGVVLGGITDPENWAYTAAIIAGLILALYGLHQITQVGRLDASITA